MNTNILSSPNRNVKRTPAAPYIPVAKRAGLGFRSAYGEPVPPVTTATVAAPDTDASYWLRQAAGLLLGGKAVRAYRRSGRQVRGYVRDVPMSTAPIPDEAIEAQCAEYDARGENAAYEAQMAGWRSTGWEVF